MNEQLFEQLLSFAKQRAALMALIARLMEADDNYTAVNLKIAIANFFGRQIEEGNMVDDLIDREVLIRVKDWADQQKAVEDASDLING